MCGARIAESLTAQPLGSLKRTADAALRPKNNGYCILLDSSPRGTTKVRITNDARKCVVFLGDCDPSGNLSEFAPRATGFFVGSPEVWPDVLPDYLITVKHFAMEGEPFWIRMNTQDGAIVHLIENPDWKFHDDPSVDLAVMKFSPPEGVVWIPWYQGMVSDRSVAHDQYFGPGDLTYTVGLFMSHRGRSKNVPLVHTGHIAAFSQDEKVEVQDWDFPHDPGKRKLIDAYIVQCSAMPGASGSPVFIRDSIRVTGEYHSHDDRGKVIESRPGWLPNLPQGYGALHLLGVWQGSWELPPRGSVSPTRLPAGYGIVIPGQKISEILKSLK